ncbi:MAG: hypothetical protein H6624_02905 [Bdellovibrionaceae bacterium]|nr:hypothetical protein [Bdellovibrionales bacterium]MCB9083262.1 hypothetical protein [Pseudobdellovibrionaceae bacterium]
MKKLFVIAVLLTGIHGAGAESIYRATTRFAQTTFQDILVFDNLPEYPFGFGTQVTGSLTVPGKFSVPLEGRMYGISWSDIEPHLDLKVRVVEGGEESLLDYVLRPDPQMDRLTGEIKNEKGEVIGTVEAVRVFFAKEST